MSYRQSLYSLILTLLIVITPLSLAAAPYEIGGRLNIEGFRVFVSDKGFGEDFADVNLHMATKVWTLLGEPVQMCTGWWELNALNVEGQRFTMRELPTEVANAIRIWGGEFWLPFDSKQNTGFDYIKCDPGSFWGPGVKKASFNVPESRGWDKQFYTFSMATGYALKSATPRSSDYAKNILKRGQALFRDELYGSDTVKIEGLRLDIGAVYRWLNEYREASIQEQEQSVSKNQESAPDDFDALFKQVDQAKSLKTTKREHSGKSTQRQRVADAMTRSRDNYEKRIASRDCGKIPSDSKAYNNLFTFIQTQRRGHQDCSKEELRPSRGSNNLVGFKDAAGNWAIQPRFTRVRPFSEGLAAALEYPCRHKQYSFSDTPYCYWGYIDRTGHWQIPPRFLEAYPFIDGLAIARQPFAITKDYRYRYPYTIRASNRGQQNGWSGTRPQPLYGIIAKSGKWHVPPTYTDVSAQSRHARRFGRWFGKCPNNISGDDGGYCEIERNGVVAFMPLGPYSQIKLMERGYLFSDKFEDSDFGAIVSMCQKMGLKTFIPVHEYKIQRELNISELPSNDKRWQHYRSDRISPITGEYGSYLKQVLCTWE
ncbi:hypothetical protein FHR99_000870 [Litorivivens lipolytica]|uniref:Uncharacterized protein n=1 Tax=Litorivivens lipolytica TaxID=1524264 RepID=A0A7W4W4C2_9GAMM|nr:WG repeat-containing protein [Litorivivens lipolytica]MBB3046634.1 hypothetical protein [Litorivivens lipolytica]